MWTNVVIYTHFKCKYRIFGNVHKPLDLMVANTINKLKLDYGNNMAEFDMTLIVKPLVDFTCRYIGVVLKAEPIGGNMRKCMTK